VGGWRKQQATLTQEQNRL